MPPVNAILYRQADAIVAEGGQDRNWPIASLVMEQTQSSVARFVRRVYRRLIVLRLLEWAGMGFVIGCGAALVMIPLLRNHSESTLMLAGIITGIGAAIGLVAAALRRPGMIEAAIEADRQLDLADLLATAWVLENANSQEDFELAVLTIARDRAANLQPRSVVLYRLGVRAWGGIGLAGALVLTIAILTANPLETDASISPLLSAGNFKTDSQNVKGGTQTSTGHRPDPIAQDHPGGDDEGLPGAGKTTDVATNPNRANNTDTTTSNSNGAGTGAGQSPTAKNNSHPLDAGTNSSRTNSTGPAASGVGISSQGNGTTGNNSSTAAGANGKSPSVPAWQSDSWPAAKGAADAAISAGQIPPAYHDLVREYFSR